MATAPAHPIRALLLDLDDTLMPDEEAIEASLTASVTEVLPEERPPQRFAAQVRTVARELWRASPYWPAGQHLGLASWELLWGSFEDGDETIAAIRGWLPEFRRRTWTTALERAGLPGHRWPRLQAALVRERRRRCQPYAGVPEMLGRLRSEHRLAIVTNGPPDLQRTKIQLAGFGPLVDAIVISGEIGAGKPDPRIFEVALQSLDSQAREALMVGDNPERDVAGAQAAGLRAVWVSHGRQVPDAIQADGVIASAADLESELDRLGSREEVPHPGGPGAPDRPPAG